MDFSDELEGRRSIETRWGVECVYGLQNYGTWVRVYETRTFDPDGIEYDNHRFCVAEEFVPAKHRYESDTINKAGGRGAVVDFPDDEAIARVCSSLRQVCGVQAATE